jgi:hypothetical protein
MSFVIGRDQSPAVETPLAGSDTEQGGPQYIKLGPPRRSDGHEGGIPSHDEMARALPQPSKSPRRVDKDRIERATRESRIMIDKERAAREEKTERLRQMRLARACQ